MFGNDNTILQENLQTLVTDITDFDKRPPNAFILFMKAVSPSVSQSNPNLSQNDINKLIGKMWQMAEETIRNEFREQAKQLAETFKNMHPNYIEYTKKKKVMSQPGDVPEPIRIKVILNRDIQNFVPEDHP
ncbi:Transcription factor SOX-17 [Tritrichomonas musculus]|uniref:Transcription factor SOX-17 n=1 Tax=Tritrichomonas musculus TaxID=1915356 RepID=A0ABR2KAH5_9EUKA